MWRVARWVVYWLVNIKLKRKLSQQKILPLPGDDKKDTTVRHSVDASVWAKMDKKSGVTYADGFDPHKMQKDLEQYNQKKWQ